MNAIGRRRSDIGPLPMGKEGCSLERLRIAASNRAFCARGAALAEVPDQFRWQPSLAFKDSECRANGGGCSGCLKWPSGSGLFLIRESPSRATQTRSPSNFRLVDFGVHTRTIPDRWLKNLPTMNAVRGLRSPTSADEGIPSSDSTERPVGLT